MRNSDGLRRWCRAAQKCRALENFAFGIPNSSDGHRNKIGKGCWRVFPNTAWLVENPAPAGFRLSRRIRKLKILVTVKLVPDTNADKCIDPATKRLVRTGVETVLNAFDEYAIEAALQLKEKLADGSTVTIVSMTPESGKEID